VESQILDCIPSRLTVSLVSFLASMLFFLYAMSTTPNAKAAALQWTIVGPVYSNTTYEYGWHFDEGGNWGAKDFEKGPYPDTLLYAGMQLNSGWLWRYTIYDPGIGCRGYAYAAYSVNGYEWYGVGGLDLHWLHLSSVNVGWTNSMQNYGDVIWYSVGNIATSGSCLPPGGAHVHFSSDLADLGSPTYVYRVNQSSETCWGDENKCNKFSYSRKHVSGSACPPGQYTTSGGPFPRSGTISQYVCETWSRIGRSQYAIVFEMWF